MTAPLLELELGGPALAVQLGGTWLELEHVGPVTISHGRTDTAQQPSAASCQLELHTEALPDLPAIGSPLVVELGAGAIAYTGLAGADLEAATTRFSGHVTDVAAIPDRLGSPARLAVTAVSRRARLGRTFVGDAPWPAELDGARAGRILALAAPVVGAPVGIVDGGTVDVLSRDVDRQPALNLLDELAVSTGGTLVELRSGELVWHDAEHRQRSAVDVELSAYDVLAGVTAGQHLAGIVNRLTVEYGVKPAEGERPAVTYADPGSELLHGPFEARLASLLSAEADAAAFARLTVGRRSRPAWELRSLEVELARTVPAVTAGLLLRLEFADLVRVVGFPAAPFASARLWVEGWSEQITRTAWRMRLDVSSYGRSAPEPRWVDLNPQTSWADAGELTWLQTVGWDSGEFISGRWVDVPQDARWLTYDPEPSYADTDV